MKAGVTGDDAGDDVEGRPPRPLAERRLELAQVDETHAAADENAALHERIVRAEQRRIDVEDRECSEAKLQDEAEKARCNRIVFGV